MEKKRTIRVVFLITLLIGVLGVSIGFAAWSSSLVINQISSSVSKGDEAASFTNLLSFETPTCTPSGGATIENTGSIDASKHTWSNASVSLTGLGQSVTCNSVVSNASAFIAYIKSINISDVISCSNTTLGQSVTDACNSIKLSVSATIDDKTSTATVVGSSITNALDITEMGIPAKNGDTNGTANISFTIEYLSNGVPSDADFVATIPTMTFTINTLD